MAVYRVRRRDRAVALTILLIDRQQNGLRRLVQERQCRPALSAHRSRHGNRPEHLDLDIFVAKEAKFGAVAEGEAPNVDELRLYLQAFVRFVPTAIYFRGQKVSQGRLSDIGDRENFTEIREGRQEWHDGDLVIVGALDFAGGVAATHIAKWDGDTWSPLGSGSDPYDPMWGWRQAAHFARAVESHPIITNGAQW